MPNWDKLNAELDNLLAGMDDHDWDRWMAQRDENRRRRRLNMGALPQNIKEEGIQYQCIKKYYKWQSYCPNPLQLEIGDIIKECNDGWFQMPHCSTRVHHDWIKKRIEHFEEL